MAADDIVKEYHRISRNTLDKVFTLKNKTCKQIYIANVDDLLNIERHDLQRCKVRNVRLRSNYRLLPGESVPAMQRIWILYLVETHDADTSSQGPKHWIDERFCNTPVDCLSSLFKIWRNSTDLPGPRQTLWIPQSVLVQKSPPLRSTWSIRPGFGRFPRSRHANEVVVESQFFKPLPRDGCSGEDDYRRYLRSSSHRSFSFRFVSNQECLFVYASDSYRCFLLGPDSSGDIMNFTEDYLAYFMGETGKFQLITCDGSFDCTVNIFFSSHRLHSSFRHGHKFSRRFETTPLYPPTF